MEAFKSVPKHLAITGRVKSWLQEREENKGNSKYRLPVSCTTFNVEDRFEGPDGIIDSWKFATLALKNGAGVALNLSKLSPDGHERESGVQPSGPVSFAEVYSSICHTIRRGGRKIGAVNLFLDASHPDAPTFVNAPRDLLPWAKRTLYVSQNPILYPYWQDIKRALNRGDLWLAKKSYDKDGNRLYSNVCLEVLLKHRGSCLLSHTNLGTAPTIDLPSIMAENMNWLCNLHSQTGVGESGLYLPHTEDRQVGLGWIGLANKLAIIKTPYWEFVEDLQLLKQETDFAEDELKGIWSSIVRGDRESWTASQILATAIAYGYHCAAKVARSYGMDRAFVIAPTATVSYAYKDSQGFTTAPEISAPLNTFVDRDSQEFGVQTYHYHPDTETAIDVGWETQFNLLCLFQDMMKATGLAHSISANWWVDFDENQASKWWESPLVSTYYRLIVDQQALDKTQTRACTLDDLACECRE